MRDEFDPWHRLDVVLDRLDVALDRIDAALDQMSPPAKRPTLRLIIGGRED